MPIRISGLNSGLDTESIISALVSSYATKKDNYVKAQTKLTWKQDAWKSLNSKIYSLYSSVGNLRYNSAYSLKKTTVSDSTKATVTASSSAISGSQSLKISQLAKAGYITGGTLTGATADSTLGSLGYEGTEDGVISVTSGGKTTDISVNKDTKVSDFVKSLQDAGLNASFDATNKRMFVSAKDTGTANDFSLTAGDTNGLTALAALGLSVNSSANNSVYVSNAVYAKNSEGQDYFVLDENGNYTYDEDNNIVTNGTYDAAKTQESIKNIMDTLAAAYSEKSKAETENVGLNASLNYANAYKAVSDLRNGTYAAQIAELEKLSAVASPATTYVGADGTQYTSVEEKKDAKGNTTYIYKYTDEDGKEQTYESSEKLQTAQERMDDLAKETGLVTTTTDEKGKETVDKTALAAFQNNLKVMKAYESVEEHAEDVASTRQAYANGSIDATISSIQDSISANRNTITAQNQTIAANSYWDTGDYTSKTTDELAAGITDKVNTAAGLLDGSVQLIVNTSATRVDAQDAKITLNNADFTSSTNSFDINGLNIKVTGVTTGDDEITITTDTDTQGLYDKVKDFLTQYNEIINEITSMYNADSASGYDPLTDEEKEQMTDTEIEKWEQKIKDSLLRRDSTLEGVMSAMTNAMSKSYEINGKNYALSSFGISTLGFLNAAENENYAYHIAGDADDAASASGKDKLMAALNSDPDSVVEFMKQLSSGLYDSLDQKMKSTSISSAYTVYNDKEMASEYSDYTDLIRTWEDRLADMEDSYYKKFSAMEAALATLQSSSSSLSSLLGGS